MESLSKSIRRVGLRINLVDTGDLVLSILTNEGLVDTEMLGRGMIETKPTNKSVLIFTLVWWPSSPTSS